MKKKEDKYLNNFTKKIIKKTSLESPSFNFTSNVMSQVTALNNSKVTVYKPLISKKGWILISLIFIALCVYLIFGGETQSVSWFSTLNFSTLTNNRITNTISGFNISKTLMYAIVFFGLMLCIQIPFLKNYFDKQYEV